MLGLIVVVIIFGGIGVSSITGSWQTTSTKIPAKYTSGEFAGQYNPADIRGSYTFGEISEAFNVPLNDLAVAFGMEGRSSLAEVQCKELEALYVDAASGNSVGTNSVRIFVAPYKGLPITLSDTDITCCQQQSKFLKRRQYLPQNRLFLGFAHITANGNHCISKNGSSTSFSDSYTHNH